MKNKKPVAINKAIASIEKEVAGARIVLRLFSGLPNPQWTIPPEVTQEVLRALKDLPPVALAKAFTSLEPRGKPADTLGRPRSGYRGFLVYGPNSEKPLADFQIFRRLVIDAAGGKVLRDDTAETLERQLYKTAPPDVFEMLNHAPIDQITAPGSAGPIEGVEGPYVRRRCARAPRYIGANDRFNNFTDLNHCYNYATKVLNEVPRSNPAIPGQSNTIQHFSVNRLRDALDQDDLENRGMEQPTRCPPQGTYYIAALVRHTANGLLSDIHFLRLDKTGRWSHKDGDDPVDNSDDLGDLIGDLTQANFLGSCKLAGFYLFYRSRRDRIN